MTRPRTHPVLIIATANLAMFIADRTFAPGVAPIAFVVSLAALTGILGRALLRPPVVAATIVLVALTLVELADAGALPAIRVGP